MAQKREGSSNNNRLPRMKTRCRSESTAGACSTGPSGKFEDDFQETTWQAFWQTSVEGKETKEVAGSLANDCRCRLHREESGLGQVETGHPTS